MPLRCAVAGATPGVPHVVAAWQSVHGVPAARRGRQVRLVRQTRRWRHRVLDVRVAHDARRRVRRRVAVPREVDPRRVRRRLVVVAVGRRAGPAAGRGPDPVVDVFGSHIV